MCGYVGARPYGGLSRVRVDGCKARRHVPAPRRSAAPCLALLLVLFPREDAGQAAPSRHTTVAVSVSSTRKDFSHASNYRDGRYHRWSPPLLTSSPGPLGNIGRANFSPSRLHRPLRLRLYRTSTSALCLSPSKSLSPACPHRWAEVGRPAGRCPNTWDKRYISAASTRLCLLGLSMQATPARLRCRPVHKYTS